MGMIYTESYETRKAHNEVFVDNMVYRLDYIINSPIDGKATKVEATFSQEEHRIGYGSYNNGASSMRFDSQANVPINAQIAISEQFMTNLIDILK